MAVDSTVQFKRGKKNDLPYGLEGEPLYCTDTNELYVGQGKDLPPKLINANGTGGSGGGTEIDDNSTGLTTTWSASKINQMYGGGTGVETTPVSHSFIELYNFRNDDLNLKGVYLWYRAKAGTWESLPLKGIVPAKHSFLIRCGKHQDFYADGVRCNITDYDMSWDKKLVNKGFSVYLCIGADTPEDNPTRQTKDALGKYSKPEDFTEVDDATYEPPEEKPSETEDPLATLKKNQILLSKKNLAKYLEEHPLFSTCKYEEGRYYNVTAEKQQQLTSKVLMATMYA